VAIKVSASYAATIACLEDGLENATCNGMLLQEAIQDYKDKYAKLYKQAHRYPAP
jgi:hypothetical protein